MALDQGATDAGGEELFARLEHGAFHWEEYDFVVAHSDWSNTISKLRHVLKERLPTLKNGRIGEDVTTLVSTYVNGVSLESSPLEGVPEINHLDVVVGQLCWEDNALSDNMLCYFDTIESQKSSRVVGDAIESVHLSCPPTGEQFLLDCTSFMEQLKPAKRDNETMENKAEEEAIAA
ncbi:50S ribosomal protein L1 [Fasciola gigantica]|uniref:50S ribosomal protein L1 n=1 Tax=Fasciola gigantica TaxID=46835 RepID=A0A504YUC3_FASGI|nr:50S ribosomal protein L1 [Fasciola gigantica]